MVDEGEQQVFEGHEWYIVVQVTSGDLLYSSSLPASENNQESATRIQP